LSSRRKKHGFCFVVSAPSGSGKTTVIRRAVEEIDDLKFVVSCTTREPRPGEAEGGDYRFVDKNTFEKMIQEDAFLEWAKVHENYYGTPKEPFFSGLKAGDSIILEIDVQGARQVQKAYPSCISICILPSSPAALRSRLKARGVDAEQEIQRRLETARGEIEALDRYKYLIINDDLENAVSELVSIIIAERCRFEYRNALFDRWKDAANVGLP